MSDLILHFVVSDALMISRIEFCSEIIENECYSLLEGKSPLFLFTEFVCLYACVTA